ncbi:MAG: histidine kinase [Acidimicrobiales bacterium]
MSRAVQAGLAGAAVLAGGALLLLKLEEPYKLWLQIVVFAAPVTLVASLVLARAAGDRLLDDLTRIGTGGPGDTFRDALRRTLADPTLEIVYPRFGRGGWVNELGEQTVTPAPTAGRPFTPIDRGGKPVAGLLHDPALLRHPQRLRAAIDAASLAIDNERLKAELRAEIFDVQASRARIVAAGERGLQRVERNLHDGAQQRLVGLALTLRLASRRAAGDAEVTALLADAAIELDDALAELRELTRGLHPAIVDDAGLAGALETLAERPGLPVDLQVQVPDRLAEQIEVAAYYVVAEALTNTNKHSRAQGATVRAALADGALHVAVGDDGRGGAAAAPGSGLEGLADRVSALGGHLSIDSPVGGGTIITATLPLSVPVVSDVDRRRMTALKWIGFDLWEMPPEAFEQITDEDNLLDAQAIMLCAGGNAALTEPEREWLVGYLTAAGDADWVIEAVKAYDDSHTIEELMRVQGFPEIARGQLYDALRMCSSDGPLTTEELDHIERAADAMGVPREVVAELHEIVVAHGALRRRRYDVIAAPVLPHVADAPSSWVNQ